MKHPDRQKDGECSPLGSRPGTTVSRSFKSPMNFDHSSNGTIHHQKNMEKRYADSYLSEKEKFLKKHKKLIDKEVTKDGTR